jgi:hypothetical protein
MTFTLDSALIDNHEEMCDFLIDGFPGKTCRLIYEPKDLECPNCFLSPDTGVSTSIYKSGGPVPFTNYTVCPHCNGFGRLQTEETENIRLRVYFNQKQFIQTAETKNIVISGDTIQVIGYMIDMPKIQRAKEMTVDTQIEGYKEYRFQPLSTPIPWGFRHQKYFTQLWKRNS